MKSELLRRLSILEETKIPPITARMLRGGMQERLHRQQVIKFGKDIKKEKKKIKSKLKSIAEQEKNDMIQHEFGLGPFNSQSIEPLDDFHEPMLRRIRHVRGFFDE